MQLICLLLFAYGRIKYVLSLVLEMNYINQLMPKLFLSGRIKDTCFSEVHFLEKKFKWLD